MKHVSGNRNKLLLLTIPFFFVACVTYVNTIDKKNASFLYNPTEKAIHPQNILYHKSDSASVLVTMFQPKELLFHQANETHTFQALLKVHYALYPSYSNNQLIDSGSIIYRIDAENKFNDITGYIPIKIGFGQFLLQITYTDMLRAVSTRSFIEIEKADSVTPQDFVVLSYKNKMPRFNNNVTANDSLLVRYKNLANEKLYVYYYRDSSTMPAPPFYTGAPAENQLSPDSMWIINSGENPLIFNKIGLYQIKNKQTDSSGVTLYNFGEHFPRIKTTDKALEPLRYLTGTKEFMNFANELTKKNALDKFWLTTTGDKTQSRELIRIFYMRVLFANLYFTSIKPGWKTDRGMIYIVYGPPDAIHKNNNSEKWSYSGTKNNKNTEFIFNKQKHNLSANHYTLQRVLEHKDNWYNAVESWRSGKTFTF